jgi:hypothetical protein
MLYAAVLKGYHLKKKRHVVMEFVTDAIDSQDAKETIEEWFDLSGIRVDSFEAYMPDTQAFCTKSYFRGHE